MSNRIEYTKASPDGYKAFGGVYVYIQKSSLPKELIDLVYLRVSQMNGCAYCIDTHSRDLLKLGITVDKIVLVPVWREAGGVFSARERSALAWAETVTRVAETGVPEAAYEAAAAEFSDKELADLTYWTVTQHGVRIPKATYALALIALVICIILSIVFR